jgi:hypothetical protein
MHELSNFSSRFDRGVPRARPLAAAGEPHDVTRGDMSLRHFGHGILFVVTVGLPTAIVATPTGLAVAQSASIVGHVVDAGGQPIPGVSVTTIEETGGATSRAISDRNGVYQFEVLPDGTYHVDFELRGFDLIRRNYVQVRRDTVAKVDTTMFVSAICECVDVSSVGSSARGETTLRERSGQVVDESGRPLPHARLALVSSMRSAAAYADGDGRFQVRLPVNDRWSLTVSDGGFRTETQQVSGNGARPLVFRLARATTAGLPDLQRFTRGCRCPGDPFTHEGR